MDKFQIILLSTFLIVLVLSCIGKKRFPEKFNKILPYNFVVLGSLFCYLSQAKDNTNILVLCAGVGFFAYGIFLIAKRKRLEEPQKIEALGKKEEQN